jgi:hypothetical protein
MVSIAVELFGPPNHKPGSRTEHIVESKREQKSMSGSGIADLEEDERSEYQIDKLGDLGDTPLDAAELARAEGKGHTDQHGDVIMSRRVEQYNRKVAVQIDKMLGNLDRVETADLVKAIDAKLRFCSHSEDAARNHWLDAARMYVALRKRIEAEGTNWWKWHKDNFDRSKADASRLLAIGAADDPVAALN